MGTIHIDRTLYQDKPTDGIRLEKEMAVYDLLDQLRISYIRLDHDATATIDDCDEVDALLGIEICKNLFLCNGNKTEFYLLLMPGKKKFVTKELSRQLGISRLSFASADYMEQFLNITPGSVSILGLMNDTKHNVKLLIDNEVVNVPFMGCHPCVNTSSLKISTKDILEKFLAHTGHTPMYVEL
ncbi:MAG: YbaK/prolyl-tRNA synthetase [Herbinix sp.]|jgi:Ala-tRNA(Pro) deacylase|nr:YbaK/prolyl-tRNA synthetase [Herbinix sp.]